jgi:ATP-dependent DNA helicase RecQ
VATESRLTLFSSESIEAAPIDEAPPTAPVLGETETPAREAPLSVADLRLLRALQAERAAIARRCRIAPRDVAGDSALRALAARRPRRADDPLFAAVAEPSAFLGVIDRFIGEQ